MKNIEDVDKVIESILETKKIHIEEEYLIDQLKELISAKSNLEIALHINKSNIELIEWNDYFIEYIEKKHLNEYNNARDYVNKKIHIGEEKEEDKFTCCGIEITGEIEDVGLCPECLEHI